jgi:RNA polymerase sigma-70 factor (ECF subfamily)
MSETTDEELMSRLQGGDELALNELMQRWQQPVLNYLYRLGGNRAEAEDLAQATFVRIYQQREKYRSRGKFAVWLFTIATNLFRNQVRWRWRHPQQPWEEGEDPRDRGLQPDEAAIQREQIRVVRAALAALPVKLRTVLLLAETQEYEGKELALILGCTVKAVETRLYRARQLLREKLNLLK